jgi:predicted DNA-binding protein
MDKAIGIRVDAVMQERLRILSVVLSKSTSELVRSALEVLLEKHKDEIDAIIRVQKGVKH